MAVPRDLRPTTSPLPVGQPDSGRRRQGTEDPNGLSTPVYEVEPGLYVLRCNLQRTRMLALNRLC
jgi:hypothetical protein